MKPSPIRIVITDIDGTLLADDGSLPEANREALALCRRLGVKTCLATGRRWTTCSRLMDRLELRNLIDFGILNNGMIVHDVAAGRSLSSRDFPFSAALEAVERLNTLGLDPIFLGHNPDGGTRDVFFRRDSLSNADFIDKNPDHCLKVNSWEELRGSHLVELVMIGPKAALDRAAAALAPLDLELAVIRNTFYREYMLEVTPRGISKLLGARELLAHLGLQESQALAIGDSGNDYQMLKHLPNSVAVSTGDEKALSAAKEITGANHEGGFAQAVNRWLGL